MKKPEYSFVKCPNCGYSRDEETEMTDDGVCMFCLVDGDHDDEMFLGYDEEEGV